MTQASKANTKLQETLDAVASLPEAEQRFVACVLASTISQLSMFNSPSRELLEDLILELVEQPGHRDQFSQSRDQLRADLPIAVSAQFLESYKRGDTVFKFTIRKLLTDWTLQQHSDEVLVTAFLKNPSLCWVQIGTGAVAVLSKRDERELWISLFRFTNESPFAKLKTKDVLSATELRTYLDAL